MIALAFALLLNSMLYNSSKNKKDLRVIVFLASILSVIMSCVLIADAFRRMNRLSGQGE